MSSTMVATVAKSLFSIKANGAGSSGGANCPSCGFDLPPPPPSVPLNPSSSSLPSGENLAAAQVRIAELENEVRVLGEKAMTATNRWAEYEAEVARLRSRPPSSSSSSSPSPTPAVAAAAVGGSPPRPTGQTSPVPPASSALRGPASYTERFQALLYSRNKSAASTAPTTTTTTANTTEDLLEALTREQGLRQEAEGRLSATSKEMEELSVALFEQANEMVAEERRARARLEERVGELERRDADKKRRLDRLESAMNRVERVKDLLRNGVDS